MPRGNHHEVARRACERAIGRAEFQLSFLHEVHLVGLDVGHHEGHGVGAPGHAQLNARAPGVERHGQRFRILAVRQRHGTDVQPVGHVRTRDRNKVGAVVRAGDIHARPRKAFPAPVLPVLRAVLRHGRSLRNGSPSGAAYRCRRPATTITPRPDNWNPVPGSWKPRPWVTGNSGLDHWNPGLGHRDPGLSHWNRHSRHPSPSFPRKRESRGGGGADRSASATPPLPDSRSPGRVKTPLPLGEGGRRPVRSVPNPTPLPVGEGGRRPGEGSQ